jgi:hypothetical protein
MRQQVPPGPSARGTSPAPEELLRSESTDFDLGLDHQKMRYSNKITIRGTPISHNRIPAIVISLARAKNGTKREELRSYWHGFHHS